MLLDASGIVFMFAVLSSLVNVRKKTVPQNFILVCVGFLGNKLALSLNLKTDSLPHREIASRGNI